MDNDKKDNEQNEDYPEPTVEDYKEAIWYKCSICTDSFLSEEELISHNIQYHQ